MPFIIAMLALTVPEPGQSAARGWRDAVLQEIVGAWEYSKDMGKQNPFWYVVVSEDGQIGWAYSKEQIPNARKSYLIDLINQGTSSGIAVSGWETARLTPGNIEVTATSQHVEEYLVVWVGVEDRNKDKIVIGQAYRLPPQQPNADQRPMLPPHMPALQLRELHRLPD